MTSEALIPQMTALGLRIALHGYLPIGVKTLAPNVHIYYAPCCPGHAHKNHEEFRLHCYKNSYDPSQGIHCTCKRTGLSFLGKFQ